jgi:hypothetical protein
MWSSCPLKNFWNKHETNLPLSARLLNPRDIIRETEGPSGGKTVNAQLTKKEAFSASFKKKKLCSYYKESP